MREGRAELGREETDRILKERARALARPFGYDEEPEGSDVVALSVGEERYGVVLSSVVETLPLENLAPVPGTPAFWAGVVNVRGTIYPVVDLRRYLGVSLREPSAGSRMLVIVSRDTMTIGLMVDAVDAIAPIAAGDMGQALPGGAAGGPGVVSSVTRTRITVLDVAAMIADPRLIVREEVS